MALCGRRQPGTTCFSGKLQFWNEKTVLAHVDWKLKTFVIALLRCEVTSQLFLIEGEIISYVTDAD